MTVTRDREILIITRAEARELSGGNLPPLGSNIPVVRDGRSYRLGRMTLDDRVRWCLLPVKG